MEILKRRRRREKREEEKKRRAAAGEREEREERERERERDMKLTEKVVQAYDTVTNVLEKYGKVRERERERERESVCLFFFLSFILELTQPWRGFILLLQPAFHYGLIPLIIVVGMSIKQDGRRPTLAQLLSPM